MAAFAAGGGKENPGHALAMMKMHYIATVFGVYALNAVAKFGMWGTSRKQKNTSDNND